MTTLFGTSTTGSNLQFEMQTGAHERLLVTPLSRSSQLVGRSLKEMVPLVAQAVIVILVMLPFGFRADPVGAPIGLAMLAVLGVGLGSLSYALAIAVRKQEWMFWVVQQTVLFPLLILSGMLLPLETGPQWMKVASAFDPLRWVVEAERALFAGDLTSSAVAAGLARGGPHGGRRAGGRGADPAAQHRLSRTSHRPSGARLPLEKARDGRACQWVGE